MCNNYFITVSGKTDGFGAQVQAIFNGFAFSRFYKIGFSHTQLMSIEHDVLAEDVEQLFNFSKLESPDLRNLKKLRVSNISDIANSDCPSEYFTEEVLQCIRSTCNFDIYNEISQVAIHIRRGDVTNLLKNRWVPLSFYKDLIKIIRKLYPGLPISIYSEGDIRQFDDLINLGIEVKLNLDTLTTFQELVRSKYLVTAPSSFSYLAALISPNIVFYYPFWHRPLDDWISLKDFGNFQFKMHQLNDTIYRGAFKPMIKRLTKFGNPKVSDLGRALLRRIVGFPFDFLKFFRRYYYLKKHKNKCSPLFSLKGFPFLSPFYVKMELDFRHIYFRDAYGDIKQIDQSPHFDFIRSINDGKQESGLQLYKRHWLTISAAELQNVEDKFITLIAKFCSGVRFDVVDVQYIANDRFVVLDGIHRLAMLKNIKEKSSVLVNVRF